MDTSRHRKKALFIDRDGVIVIEDQIDSFEKIIYKPHVFEALREISRRRVCLDINLTFYNLEEEVSYEKNENCRAGGSALPGSGHDSTGGGK